MCCGKADLGPHSLELNVPEPYSSLAETNFCKLSPFRRILFKALTGYLDNVRCQRFTFLARVCFPSDWRSACFALGLLGMRNAFAQSCLCNVHSVFYWRRVLNQEKFPQRAGTLSSEFPEMPWVAARAFCLMVTGERCIRTGFTTHMFATQQRYHSSRKETVTLLPVSSRQIPILEVSVSPWANLSNSACWMCPSP